MNFQASELARVLLLTYIASYAVRRADELRSDFTGFMQAAAACCGGAAVLLLLEPDFGAATVLFATGLGRAVPRRRAPALHLLVPVVLGVGGASALLAVISPLPPAAPDRLPRSLGAIRSTAASS